MTEKNDDNLINANGTSQAERLMPALQSTYVSIEERSVEDLLAFLQRYAKGLHFYDHTNTQNGDWSAFLSNHVPDAVMRKIFVDFMDDPEKTLNEHPNLSLLTEPHVALLLTFFHLLKNPLKQFNQLTSRHLDFYYKQVLRLQPKAAQADSVNVVFELSSQQRTPYLLSKGTLLNAGKDSLGKDLNYALDADVLLNQAKVSQVQKLFCTTEYQGLKDQSNIYDPKSIQYFVGLLRWAVGDPIFGGSLPDFFNENKLKTNIDAHQIYLIAKALEKSITNNNQPSKAYVIKELYFSRIEDFIKCFKAITYKQTDIAFVFEKIEEAYNKKCIFNLLEIYQKLITEDDSENIDNFQLDEARRFFVLNTVGFFSLEQFKTGLMSVLVTEGLLIKDDQEQKNKINLNNLEEKWQAIFKGINIFYKENIDNKGLQVFKRKVTGIYTKTEFSAKHSFNPQGFKMFGKKENEECLEANLGFAIASPLLYLTEGLRKITLTFSAIGFDFEKLQKILSICNPFDVYLSNIPAKLDSHMDCGNFILQEPCKIYEAAKDIQLIVEIPNLSAFKENEYLHFPDGMLYQVKKGDKDPVNLQSLGYLPADFTLKRYKNLTFGAHQDLRDISRVLGNKLIAQLPKGSVEQFKFTDKDVGKFIFWQDGYIDIITKFTNSLQVEIENWGYLLNKPSVSSLYEDLTIAMEENVVLEDRKVNYKVALQSDAFVQKDVGKILQWNNGKLFKLTKIENPKTAKIEPYTDQILAFSDKVVIYPQDAIFTNAIQLTITLDKTVLPVLPTTTIGYMGDKLPTEYPILHCMLRTDVEKIDEEWFQEYYTLLQDVKIKELFLQVTANEIENIKLCNDVATLRANTIIEPFTNMPQVGSGFYFTHAEIGQKKLDTLSLHLDWTDIPPNFDSSYWVAKKNDTDLSPKLSAISFTSSLKFMQNRLSASIINADAVKNLFSSENKTHDGINRTIIQTYSNFNYPDYFKMPSVTDDGNNDPLQWPFYYKLELRDPDLQYKLYTNTLNQIALNAAVSGANPDKYQLQIPYIPKLKSFKVSYTASSKMLFEDNSSAEEPTCSLIHIHPFGYNITGQQTYPSLLPRYDRNAYLFIEASNFPIEANTNFLFQLIEGSGAADSFMPRIEWFYLDKNATWKKAIKNKQLLTDKTTGLVNTGIMQFCLPHTADVGQDLFGSQNHWLMACVQHNEKAIPNAVAVVAQAASATFYDQNNTVDHFQQVLPPNNIQALVKQNSAIANIQQPYSSFNGKPEENNETFTTRISERLRHKQRALTTWDYERLVLEAFPEIYRVKCLNQAHHNRLTLGSAEVTLLVVSSMVNKTPRFSLEPTTPIYLLEKIKMYLQKYVSPFVKLTVKNPSYEKLYCKVVVHFNQSDTDKCSKKLNERIKQFLSPWAYEEGADITFGGKIYKTALINFIENEPYVDFVKEMHWFRNMDLIKEDFVTVSNPDAILVASEDQTVVVIDE